MAKIKIKTKSSFKNIEEKIIRDFIERIDKVLGFVNYSSSFSEIIEEIEATLESEDKLDISAEEKGKSLKEVNLEIILNFPTFLGQGEKLKIKAVWKEKEKTFKFSLPQIWGERKEVIKGKTFEQSLALALGIAICLFEIWLQKEKKIVEEGLKKLKSIALSKKL